jgi:hypothetical protein
MLSALRRASRMVIKQQGERLPAAATVLRSLSTWAPDISSHFVQQLSLTSWLEPHQTEQQPAESTAAAEAWAATLAAAEPVPCLLGRHVLVPPAAEALLELQQQQPQDIVLPEVDDVLGQIQGELLERCRLAGCPATHSVVTSFLRCPSSMQTHPLARRLCCATPNAHSSPV